MKLYKTIITFTAVICALSYLAASAAPAFALEPRFEPSGSYADSVYYEHLRGVELTGDRRTDIAAVAESQVGYHEGSSENDLGGDSSSDGNYTEYGRCFGTTSDAWCAMFIWWCAAQAGVPESAIPHNEWAHPYPFGLAAQSFSEAEPQTGDLIFTSSNGIYESHVGLVVSVDDEHINTVEGNISDRVVAASYSRKTGKHTDGSRTIMYVASPDYYAPADALRQRGYISAIEDCTARSSITSSKYKKHDMQKGTRYELLNALDYGGKAWCQFEVGLDAFWIEAEKVRLIEITWSDEQRCEVTQITFQPTETQYSAAETASTSATIDPAFILSASPTQTTASADSIATAPLSDSVATQSAPPQSSGEETGIVLLPVADASGSDESYAAEAFTDVSVADTIELSSTVPAPTERRRELIYIALAAALILITGGTLTCVLTASRRRGHQ